MKRLAIALALTSACALSIPAGPATASVETVEARQTARSAAEIGYEDMLATFGTAPKPGKYLWRDVKASGEPRVVVNLPRQLAFLYRGDEMIAAAAVSSGTEKNPTPNGIFTVLEKKRMHHSRKYDNAPMPFMQRIDKFGIALHAGHNPGRPASHGCIRLPSQFAAKLYSLTDVGTPVLIGA